MDIIFVYSPTQVIRTAEFVYKNNKLASSSELFSTELVIKSIKDCIKRLAKDNIKILLKERQLKIQTNDWNSFSGTMGYTVLMTLDEQTESFISLSIDVLVDVALGEEKTYVSEEFDLDLLLK